MSIQHAILGILSRQPVTGYDLKKVIQDSSFMHWSGNNNQIYNSLVELLKDGFVTSEVQHQESSPSKKIYTITEAGRAELKRWAASAPEPPEYKRMFLVQLAWSDSLDQEELDALCSAYEEEMKLQIALHEEKKRRDPLTPAGPGRAAALWEMIHDNVISAYRHELQWIRKLRNDMKQE